uniref:Bridge-like lipid transfer protein family member 1 C-terminal domain-containing protein n=1 Tax=Parascaris univalens TaxID=6257 RepID=A0A914ZXS8_PARUN
YISQGVRLTAELPKKSEVFLLKHSLAFKVKNLREQRLSTDCVLSLPALSIKREMLNSDEEECLIIGDENVRYKEGPYSSIIVSIGGCEETVSIDFINLLLLTKECIEAELPVVEEAVITQPAAANEDDTNSTAAANAMKKLFSLQMPSSGSSVRWMNITISDANSVAVRFTIERLSFFATNRWISYEDGKNRLFCAAQANLSARMGELAKAEMSHGTELRELITFIAQAKRFIHGLQIARKYWSTHKQKHFGNAAIPLAPTVSDSAVPTVEEIRRTIYLTVTVTDGANVYVPLYSKNLLPHTSALLIFLRAAEVTANIRKDLSVYAKFNHLKAIFIENFDQISNDLWTHSLDGMDSCSYTVFPR